MSVIPSHAAVGNNRDTPSQTLDNNSSSANLAQTVIRFAASRRRTINFRRSALFQTLHCPSPLRSGFSTASSALPVSPFPSPYVLFLLLSVSPRHLARRRSGQLIQATRALGSAPTPLVMATNTAEQTTGLTRLSLDLSAGWITLLCFLGGTIFILLWLRPTPRSKRAASTGSIS
ncbi:hypothetical protein IF2G_10881 [Cordyceps javanica]|nr:hypothetical protein IF2G_10881 [Cordyceps javanica]